MPALGHRAKLDKKTFVSSDGADWSKSLNDYLLRIELPPRNWSGPRPILSQIFNKMINKFGILFKFYYLSSNQQLQNFWIQFYWVKDLNRNFSKLLSLLIPSSLKWLRRSLISKLKLLKHRMPQVWIKEYNS